MKMTEWFPAEIKPVHAGVYETRDELGIRWFSAWRGDVWIWGNISPGAWPNLTGNPALYQRREWRGLSEELK
jgi:hypothetical protein